MSSFLTVLRNERHARVRFFNVRCGYLTDESVMFDVQYRAGHRVRDKDWLAVLPAGFRIAGRDFAALKMAPRKKVGKLAKGQSELHSVVFKADEMKLPPRNFYQIAYISTGGRVVATSALFYIEKNMKNRECIVIQNQPKPGLLSNLLCSSSDPSWLDNTASLALSGSEDSGLEEGGNHSQEDDSASETEQLLEQPEPDDSDQPTSFTSIASYVVNLLRNTLTQPPDRTTSMYEIGAQPSTSEMTSSDHYQKLLGQLTHSNANLMRENDQLQLEKLLRDHVEHLNSIYYTLFRNGYTSLELPDGQEVYLSQFHGVMLNFVRSSQSTSQLAKASTSRQMNRDRDVRTSDLSSESSLSSGSVDHQEELKAAMIKCITKPKYDDLDDFVNWLNQSRPSTRNGPERKAYSLEERVQELRIRQPLQRSSRIDEMPPSRARSDSELGMPHNLHLPKPSMSPTSPGQGTPVTRSPLLPAKSKAARLRTQSLGGGKMSFLGGRRTSSQRNGQGQQQPKKPVPRKSLANLASLRLNTHTPSRQPQRNLI